MQAATDCQLLEVDQPGVVVEIPDIERPFRLAIRAQARSKGLVLIDAIRLQVLSALTVIIPHSRDESVARSVELSRVEREHRNRSFNCPMPMCADYCPAASTSVTCACTARKGSPAQ